MPTNKNVQLAYKLQTHGGHLEFQYFTYLRVETNVKKGFPHNKISLIWPFQSSKQANKQVFSNNL